MLYRGTKPGALYKGAYKPGKLYKGTQLVAGYADVSKAAPASWDGTYDDVVGVAAQGRGKQQTYSGKNLIPYPSNARKFPVTASGVTVTSNPDGSYTVNGTATDNVYVAICNLAKLDDIIGNVAVSGCPAGGSNKTYYLSVYTGYSWLEPDVGGGTTGVIDAHGTGARVEITIMAGFTASNLTFRPQLETGSTPTAYEPYVGGQPSPSPDYPQPLVAAEGGLTASGRTGTTPTTVTLPVLRAIPGSDIRDELEYIGGGQWQMTRRVGVIGRYAGESVGATWASNTGQLNTGAVVWYALATPTTETVTLGELPSYPVHTELAVSGDYPPDVTGTVKVGA